MSGQGAELDWGTVAATVAESSAGVCSGEGSQALFALCPDKQPRKKRGRPPQKLRDLLASFEEEAPNSGGIAEPIVVPARHVVARRAQTSGEGLSYAELGSSDCLPKPPWRGRMAPVPFMANLLAVQNDGCNEDTDSLDALVIEMGKFYLTDGVYNVASGRVLESKFGCDSESLDRRMYRLCCSLLLRQHYLRNMLEPLIADVLPRESLVFYLDFSCYDETPMKLSLKDPMVQRAAGMLDPGFVAAGVPQPQALESERGQAVVAKVLQTSSSWGFLVRTSNGLLAFTGQYLLPLQSMSRTTGKNMFACLQQLSGVSLAADKFGLKVRSACTDQASYNTLGEKLLVSNRPGWCSALWYCDVHAVAGAHEKCFDQLFPQHVCGILHLALSLRVGYSWSAFKRALIAEIEEKPIEIALGRSSSDNALKHKLLLLELAFGGSPRGLASALQLLMAFNGDWRSDALQFVWDPSFGVAPAERHIKWAMVRSCLSTLCHRRPPLWPRHRWTGFRHALRPFMLLASIHSLLLGAYRRFLILLGCSTSVSTTMQDTSRQDDVEALGVDFQATSDVQPVIAWTSDAAESAGIGEAPADGPNNTDFAALNAKDRTLAWKWLQSECPYPGEVLILFSIILLPLHNLLEKHFLMASPQWEREQALHVMQCLTRGDEPHRKYRLQIAADMELEKACFGDLKDMYMRPEFWSLLPETAATFAFRWRAFVALSRIGSSIEATLCSRHMLWPCKLFKLLGNPSCAEALSHEAPCVMDSYSIKVLERWPGFQGHEIIAALRLQASQQKLDISVVESLHGSVRRQVMMRSCQTWAATMSKVSAEFYLQSWRRAGKCKTSKRRTPKKAKVRKVTNKLKRPHGGSWRAFVRQSTLGQSGSPNLQMIGRAYRKSKAEGSLQTAVHAGSLQRTLSQVQKKDGKTNYGVWKKTRKMKQMLQMRTHQAFFIRHRDETFQQKLLALQEETANIDQLHKGVALANALLTCGTASEKEAIEEQEHIVQQYEELYGADKKMLVVNTYPFLAGMNFECIPHPGFDSLHLLGSSVVDPCIKGCAWLGAKHGHPVGAALEKSWAYLHQTIHEEEASEVDSSNPDIAHGKCHAFGRCLCSPEGLKLKRARNRLLKLMKEVFNTKRDKLFLSQGHVVVRLSHAGDLMLGAGGKRMQRHFFWHVGHMLWSPYKPTFQALEWVSAIAAEPGADENIYVKATCNFSSDLGMLQDLNWDEQWDLKWYEAVVSESPVVQMEPHTIPIKASRTPLVQFWPIPRKHSARRVVQPPACDAAASWDAVSAMNSVRNPPPEPEIDEALDNLPEPPVANAEEEADLQELVQRALSECLIDEHVSEIVPEQEEEGLIGEDLVAVQTETADADEPLQDLGDQAATSLVASSTVPQEGASASSSSALPAKVRETPLVVMSGPRIAAEACCIVPGLGKIVWHASKQAFEAHCSHPGHTPKCVLTRTSKSRGSKPNNPIAGRPLGMLMCWLEMAQCCNNRKMHWNTDEWQKRFTLEARERGRATLSNVPGSDLLFCRERCRIDGEPEEPCTLAGMLR
eukprot:3827-Amphidinium_carterae.3